MWFPPIKKIIINAGRLLLKNKKFKIIKYNNNNNKCWKIIIIKK